MGQGTETGVARLRSEMDGDTDCQEGRERLYRLLSTKKRQFGYI